MHLTEVKVNEGKLGKAITTLNTRTRAQGLNSSEIHFCRDPVREINLHLDDEKLANEKTSTRKKLNDRASRNTKILEPASQGDIVVITKDKTKHKARDLHIVTQANEEKITIKRSSTYASDCCKTAY